MRIEVQRTGGFAGIERRSALNTSDRPDAAEWEALVERALDDTPQSPPPGVPDGYTYRITVGDRTIHCADPRLTDAQRELITRVLKEGA